VTLQVFALMTVLCLPVLFYWMSRPSSRAATKQSARLVVVLLVIIAALITFETPDYFVAVIVATIFWASIHFAVALMMRKNNTDYPVEE
jgi:hypothetical protein